MTGEDARQSSRNVALLIGLVLLAVMPGCKVKKSAPEQQAPSLSETLAWMSETYNPHEGGLFHTPVGHGRFEERVATGKPLQLAINYSFAYDQCRITIHSQADPIGEITKEVLSDSSITFNLGDIDPQSIKVRTYASNAMGMSCDGYSAEELQMRRMNCDEAEVTFSTHNDRPVIEKKFHSVYPNLTGADHEFRSESKEYKAFFAFDDVAYAERFEKAFRHAVELCGGRPSAF